MRKATLTYGIPALFLAMLLTAGCGGGDSSVQASTTTMGQELTDLKKAYDDGIISEKEYKRSKEQILKRYN
jgi:hypothetical protein